MTGADRSHPEPGDAMQARVRASIERQGMMATLGVQLIAIERRSPTAPRRRSRSCRPR
jgi:hypothetical protein